jgi:hypothetical protein
MKHNDVTMMETLSTTTNIFKYQIYHMHIDSLFFKPELRGIAEVDEAESHFSPNFSSPKYGFGQ